MHTIAELLDAPPIKAWAEALIGGGVRLDAPTDCMATWYSEGDYTRLHPISLSHPIVQVP
jgi:hypothetical protein